VAAEVEAQVLLLQTHVKVAAVAVGAPVRIYL
jgi:hypothetical protein